MAGRSATVAVQITGDAKQLMRAFGQAESGAQKLQRRLDSFGSAMTRSVTLPLAAAGVAAVKLAGEQEKAEVKMSSAFKSMNAAAWTSEQALKDHASAIQENSVVGDEAVLSMQSVLLTFGNLKDEVGAGNDVFSRTTQAVVDMAQALDMDLQSAAIQLGKALNDPVANLSALSRAGIQFTDEQKEMINTLWESGDALGAQKVILEELERQFGGTAAAIADTPFGKMQQALNDLGDAAEDIGAILLPVLADLAAGVADAAKSFQGLDESAQKNIVKGAIGVALIGPLSKLGAMFVGLGSSVLAAGRAFATAGMGNAIIGIASAVSKLAVAFQALGAAIAVTPFVWMVRESKNAEEQTYKMAAANAIAADEQGNVAAGMQGMVTEMYKAKNANKDLTGEILKGQAEMSSWRDEAHNAVKVTGEWPDPLMAAARSLNEVRIEADKASVAIATTGQAMLDALNPVSQLRTANAEYEEALRHLQEVQGDADASAEDLEQAWWDLLEAQGNVTAANDQFSMSGVTPELYALAAAIGLSADELDRLIRLFASANGAGFDLSVTSTKNGGFSGTVDTSGWGLNRFHDGGVVPGPMGMEQLALVKGGETILPTHKNGGRLMGEVNVIVNNPTTNDLNSDLQRALTAVRLLEVV